MVLYQLVFCDRELSYEDYKQMFCIGIFSSYDKAKETAEHYRHYVEGFKDYDCGYEIMEKNVKGNIIESQCFAQEDAAKQYLLTLRQKYDREMWNISRFVVDQCLWKEGFVRTYME